MKELRDRVAVVTGAASGIGLAAAEAFLAEGMRVVMGDINAAELDRQAERLSGLGEVEAVPVDVSDPESVAALGKAAVDRFGALHVALNNAGIVRPGLSWEIPLDEWRRVLDVNLWGVINGIRAFVPLILQTGQGGHVVNTASMASVRPLARLGPYTASKHAVLGLTDVLRAELQDIGAPVGASVVMPGLIRTEMNPIGSIEPSQVAANIVDAIRRGRPYVFTDDHSATQVETRLREIISARSDFVV